MKRVFATLVVAAAFCGCQPNKSGPTTENVVVPRTDGQPVRKEIKTEDGQKYLVVSDNQITVRSPVIKDVKNPNALRLGFPAGLLNQQVAFGGVITKVSVPDVEEFGGLKLSDVPPVHARTRLAKDQATGQEYLALYGCESNCSETSAQSVLLQIPVVGRDPQQDLIFLDLSALGEQMNVMTKMGTAERMLGLKFQTSETKLFDFSLNTLVFDVDTLYKWGPNDDKDLTLTVRYYIKLGSGFNPAYTSREQTKGVGYFTTSRGANTRIIRFSVTGTEDSPVKYYIKNVPAQYQASFAKAFDDWNVVFKKVVGHNVLAYEFVADNDPRHALLVAGDVRYNIMEWDITNKASYGGLGPSIGNEYTGETLSANVLIQGPEIEKLYKDWFKISIQAKTLRAQGLHSQADRLERNFHVQQERQAQRAERAETAISLGEKLHFRMSAKNAHLQDPKANRMDFEPLPENFTYDTYMYGYFIDMVAHELGHNLGLRHNFKGNLASNDSMTEGSVSRSIMEYLGRVYRHLDRIGEYDEMAIAYGYMGKKPAHTDWFCTDDDADATDPTKSAECSSGDATGDSFGYFDKKFARIIDAALGRGNADAPTWTIEDLASVIQPTVAGMAAYASSAMSTGTTWVNFNKDATRPTTPEDVPAYVIQALSAQICAPLEDVVANKATPAAKAAAQKNLEELRQGVYDVLSQFTRPFPVYTSDGFPCLVQAATTAKAKKLLSNN